MYEYAPHFLKKKEKRLCYGFFGLAAILFVASAIDGLPLPWLFQTLAVAAIVPMITVYSLCLSRDYTYTVQARKDAAPDFIITEHVGKRSQVVCRISVASVQRVEPLTKETKRAPEKSREGRQYFSYTGVLFDERQCYVYAEECDTALLLRICADDTLFSLLGGNENP